MTDEWKELKVDNLPPDILTGEYEFQWIIKGKDDGTFKLDEEEICVGAVIRDFVTGKAGRLHYRRIENIPSHTEIMTKWWRVGLHWWRVTHYNCAENLGGCYQVNSDVWCDKQFFTNLRSADIPPEGE